jgi:hypothetical protein
MALPNLSWRQGTGAFKNIGGSAKLSELLFPFIVTIGGANINLLGNQSCLRFEISDI